MENHTGMDCCSRVVKQKISSLPSCLQVSAFEVHRSPRFARQYMNITHDSRNKSDDSNVYHHAL